MEFTEQEPKSTTKYNTRAKPPGSELYCGYDKYSENSTLANTVTDQKERKRYVGLLYIPGLTEQLSKQLQKFQPNSTKTTGESWKIVLEYENEVAAGRMFVCCIWNSMQEL